MLAPGERSLRTSVATPRPAGVEPVLIARLTPASDCGPRARAALSNLSSLVEPELFDDLLLLSTELVTNAVRHGAGRVRLDAWVLDGSVLVEVSDRGAGLDADRFRGLGWGLRLVDEISARWGAHHDGSNHVWFELFRPATA